MLGLHGTAPPGNGTPFLVMGIIVFEVDPGILMMARMSIAAAFGVATYYVFSPPLRALRARIKGGDKRR